MRKSFGEMPDSFTGKLKAKWDEGKFLCVGLDEANFKHNQDIIDSTYDLVCSYKPQISFYEAQGAAGFNELVETVSYIQNKYPDISVILDAKRADIGTSNLGYTKAYFDNLGVDAITVNPYLGKESLEPFLKYENKGIFILVKTSNPGSSEFQDLKVNGNPLYRIVAEHVAKNWNTNGNCAVVVGATYPQELKKVREIVGDMPILVPGIGAQGGDLEAVIRNGLDSNKKGLIISSSRDIIYSGNPRQTALDLHESIRKLINE